MKKVYETPFTTHVRVEMEGRLCAGSATVNNGNKDNVGIDEHTVNTGFDGDFSNDSWDPTTNASN